MSGIQTLAPIRVLSEKVDIQGRRYCKITAQRRCAREFCRERAAYITASEAVRISLSKILRDELRTGSQVLKRHLTDCIDLSEEMISVRLALDRFATVESLPKKELIAGSATQQLHVHRLELAREGTDYHTAGYKPCPLLKHKPIQEANCRDDARSLFRFTKQREAD